MIITLIIDDSIPTRQRVCAALKDLPGVLPFGCPAIPSVVFENINGLHPECIVIDPPMHDASGFELLASLRKRNPKALLIVLANNESEEIRRRSMNLGVDYFLYKATEFERVADIVSAMNEYAPANTSV